MGPRSTCTPKYLYPPKVLTTETDAFSSIFGRTDLRIGPSKAKYCEEFDFEVRLPVRPPKLLRTRQKLLSDTEKFRPTIFFLPKIDLTGII